jgi:hypothetical protein
MNKNFTIIILFISICARGNVSPRFSMFENQNCEYKKNYQFLTKESKSIIEKEIGQRLNSMTIRKLDVECLNIKSTSSAFILSDKVRTHFQTLLIWIDKSKLQGIEVLEFHEPKKYQAPKKWVEHISKKNEKTLFEVDALSGATLTRQSTIKLLKQAFHLDKR